MPCRPAQGRAPRARTALRTPEHREPVARRWRRSPGVRHRRGRPHAHRDIRPGRRACRGRPRSPRTPHAPRSSPSRSAPIRHRRATNPRPSSPALRARRRPCRRPAPHARADRRRRSSPLTPSGRAPRRAYGCSPRRPGRAAGRPSAAPDRARRPDRCRRRTAPGWTQPFGSPSLGHDGARPFSIVPPSGIRFQPVRRFGTAGGRADARRAVTVSPACRSCRHPL